MPLITEQQFLDTLDQFETNSSNLPPEEVESLRSTLLNYESQQQELGLPLLPASDAADREYRATEKKRQREMFAGIDKIAPNLSDRYYADFITNETIDEEEKKVKLTEEANKEYFASFYETFDPADYEIAKADFAKRFNNGIVPKSELEMYGVISKIVADEKTKEEQGELVLKKAASDATLGKSYTESVAAARAELGDSFNLDLYTNQYNGIKQVIGPFEKDLNEFQNSMYRIMEGGEKEDDNKIVESFVRKIGDIPDGKTREAVLATLRLRADEFGKSKANDKFAGKAFGESFLRIYERAMLGNSAKMFDVALERVPTSGEIYTSLPDIKTQEDADAYINERLTANLSRDAIKSTALGAIGFATTDTMYMADEKALKLTPEQEFLVERAKRKAERKNNIYNEAENIAYTIDPIRTFTNDNSVGGAFSSMAAGAGSTAALVPLAAAGPVGIVAGAQIYADMEYNDIRAKTPGMSTTDRRILSNASGIAQALLDRASFGLLKGYSPLGGSISSSITQRMLVRGGTIAGGEFIIEGAQDNTTAAIQLALNEVGYAFPDVDMKAELGNWLSNSAIEVGWGLVPGVVLGLSTGTISDYRQVSNILKDKTSMLDLGFDQASADAIVNTFESNQRDAAVDLYRQAYAQRNVQAAEARAADKALVAERLKSYKENIPTQLEMDRAKALGIVPDIIKADGQYIVNIRGFKPGEQVSERFDTVEEAQMYAGQATNQLVGQINNSINNVLPTLDTTNILNQELGAFDNTLNEKIDVTARLQGVPQTVIDETNAVFGSTANFNSRVSNIARGIFNETTTSKKIIEKYGKQLTDNSTGKLSEDISEGAKAANMSELDYVNDLILNPEGKNMTPVLSHAVNRVRGEIGRGFKEAQSLIRKNSDELAARFPDPEGDLEYSRALERKDITDSLESSLPIITEQAFANTIADRVKVMQSVATPTSSTARQSLYGVRSRLSNTSDIGITRNDMADALGVLNEKKTVAEVDAMTAEEKSDIVSRALAETDQVLKASLMKEMVNFRDQIKDVNLPEDHAYNTFKNIIVGAIDNKNAIPESDAIYSKLYPKNGVPKVETTFYEDLFKYNALRFLGNLEGKTVEQVQESRNFIRGLFDMIKALETNPAEKIEFFDNINTSLETAKKELTLQDATLNKNRDSLAKSIKNSNGALGWFSDTGRVINSFIDNHLTFASMVEMIFPTKSYKDTMDAIKVLTAKDTLTVDESETLQTLRESIGKSITPGMQKIVDDINSAFLQTQASNELVLDRLLDDTRKSFGITNEMGKDRAVRKSLFEMMDITKGIAVDINGKSENLSTAFAAYILNLHDQKTNVTGVVESKFKVELEKAGFDQKTLTDIDKKLPKEIHDLRKKLVKRIRDEIAETNTVYKNIFGFGIPTPSKGFFPAQNKNRDLAVITPYDIQYQAGNFKDDFNPLGNVHEGELDLNIQDQNINLLSMFNSYMYQSIHKRTLMAPIINAKNVLTNDAIADRIEQSFGRPFIENINKMLGAFETNGIRNNMMDYITTGRLRKMLTNISRGAMGYRASTIFVNSLAGGNTLMDATIPLGEALKSYGRVLSTGMGSDARMTRKQAANSQLMSQRFRIGANSLVAMSKAQTYTDRPSFMNDFAAYSLTPMSQMDAVAGSFAAAAAFDSHYRMQERAAKEGGYILSEEELIKLATEGMVRTINKTFQPSILSGKSVIEMNGNPVIKLLTMFMSEVRKTVGLELTSVKKAYRSGGLGKVLTSAEVGRMILVNHIMLGGMAFILRSTIKDLTTDEEKDDEIWDWSKMIWMDMLVGPLSGLFVAGTVLETGATFIHNLFAEITEDRKIINFGDQSPIAQAGTQVVKLKGISDGLGVTGDGSKEYDWDEDGVSKSIDHINDILKGVSGLTGSQTASFLTVLTNIANQSYDFGTEMEKIDEE